MDRFKWGAFYNGSFMVLLLIAGAFFIFGFRRRQWLLQRLTDAVLLPHLLSGFGSDRRKIKKVLIFLTLLFGVLALMDPLYDYTWVTEKRRGVDILVALDVSKSMYAKDVSPSRFERSKLEILTLAEQMQGDRIGLVVFTSVARTQCPLTLDYEAFKLIAKEMEIGVLSQGGTSLAAALDQAIQSFDKQYKKERILIVVTDGESQDSSWEKYIDKLKEANIRVYTVGLGSISGAPILLPSEDGQKEYVKDQQGNIVLSKLDEECLKKLALTTGGAYVQTETAGFNLEKLYTEKIAPLQGRELESKRNKRYEHRFYIPLAIALFCLLLETFLQEFSRSRRREKTRKPLIGKQSWIGKISPFPTSPATVSGFQKTLMLFLIFGVIPAAKAADALREGERAFLAGDYQKAELAYQEASLSNPNSPELYFNQGAVLYKENKFENAAALFQKALSSTDPEVEVKAHYNLGNTFYRLGQLEKSVESYMASLKLNPKQPDCQHNLEFVQRKIKELLNKQKDQQNQEQKKEQKKKEEQKKSGTESGTDSQKSSGKQGDSKNEKNTEAQGMSEKSEKKEQEKGSQNQDPQKDQRQEGTEEKQSPDEEKNQTATEEQEQNAEIKKLSSEEMKELEAQEKKEAFEKSEEAKEDKTAGRLTKDEAERILKSLEEREQQKRKQQGNPPQNDSSPEPSYYKDW